MRFRALVSLTLAVCASAAFGQSGFSAKTYSGVTHTSKLVSADLNGDGVPDLVTYNTIYASTNAPASILLNDGSGNFGAPSDLSGSFGAFADLLVVDLNADNHPDIVGCYNTGSGDTAQTNVVVEMNDGTGHFTAKPTVTAPGMCYEMTVGDVYKTGLPAIVTVGYPYSSDPTYPRHSYLNVFKSDSTGALTLAQTATPNVDMPVPEGSTSNTDYINCGLIGVAGGDFFNHGTFDLVLTSACNPSNPASTTANEGTAFYASAGDSTSPGYSTFTYINFTNEQLAGGKVADLQDNGTLDVTFLGTGKGYQTIQIFYNNSAQFLTQGVPPAVQATTIGGFDLGDLDGDGGKDIVVTTKEPNAQPQLTIHYQDQTGANVTQSSVSLGTTQSAAAGVALADYNHDQRLDIAALVPDSTAQSTSLYVATNTQASNACPAPSATNTSVICSPTANQQFAAGTNSIPVLASSNVQNFVTNRIYLDNQDVYDAALQDINTTLSVGNGTHHMVFVSWNKAGTSYTSTADFTVGEGTTNGCLPTTAGVVICSVGDGATVNSSQVVVMAGARASTGTITAMRVYIDNVSTYTSYSNSATPAYQFSQTINVNPGPHYMVVVAYHNDGSATTTSLHFTSNPGPCAVNAASPNVQICAPMQGITAASPVIVSASGYILTGYLQAMRIYVDNVAVATINRDPNEKNVGFSIQQSVSMSPGSHNLVVVGYGNQSGYVSAQRTVVIQ